jgi:NAD dependent epimerase/dehydratase
MNWKNTNVLVTGAGGFIASHLLEKLVRLNANVTAFVRYNSRNDFGLIEMLPSVIKNKINVIPGDLRDSDAVYDSLDGKDIIFHLGALIAIPYSYIHSREVIETNILGTYNILNAARRLRTKKIVHTSTSEVYGSAIKIPISENHPLQAQSPYSASKIGADKIAESFYKSYDLPVAIMRPFNTFGPRQSARSIIPTIILQALKSNNVHLGSLIPKRDFTFVKDTVEGFIKIAESNEAIGETINIGSGQDISIGKLVNLIGKLLNKKIKVSLDKSRIRPENSEVDRLVADNSKADKILGWKPKVDFELGLKETIHWFKSNFIFYKPGIYNI